MPTESLPALTLTPADVAALADALRPYHAIYGSFFPRSESRAWAERYLHGLLRPLPRKSVEPMVIAQLGADEKAVRGMQQFLTDSAWDAAAILRRHWQEVAVELDDAEGMLIADGSDFAKKGQHSVGGQRQYCGELGKIANCQAGVFLAYARSPGATLLDRRLYLPEAWLSDPAFAERRATCRLPAEVTFQTKNELTLEMGRAVVESGALRCRWFLADEAFGRDTVLLDAVDGLGLWYMVEVPLDTHIWRADASAATTPKALFPTLNGRAWSREEIGEGTKGPRIAEVHLRRVRAQRQGHAGPEVWLLLRLDPESGEQKAFLSNAPATLSGSRRVRVSGMRWPVEHLFEVAKQELGMGDYAVRSWPGGHQHMTLVTLAHFFLVRVQLRLKKRSDADASPGLPVAERLVAASGTNPCGCAGADCLLPSSPRRGSDQPSRTNRTLDRE
jgi:SRSO17 transposase